MKKRICTLLCLLVFLTVSVKAAEISSGSVYKISTTYTGKRTLMVSNSSLDNSAGVSLWTETGVNAQRWRITSAGNGNYYMDNVYSGKRLYAASSTSVVQSSSGTSSTYQWILSPVNETGYENCFYIANAGVSSTVLELPSGSADANDLSVQFSSKGTTKEARQIWKIEQVTEIPNQLTPAIRTQMMQDWKNKKYNALKTSTGFWGEAECMEILLDAYETTGKEEYKTMFEEVYAHFVSGSGGWTTTNGKNWMWNEFNDDIVWATLASIRAYFMFGNNTSLNLDYLSIAKTNYDAMMSRAMIKVDDMFYLLRWKQSGTSTNSCVNGPAIVAACYLAQATGIEAYYNRAKELYANMRIHQYSATDGRVYDTFSNNWVSTYNQGGYLGAAIMLYNRFGDEMYKKDAELIMNYTRKNLCNSNGIINVCGDEGSDLPIFKGILMRYVRRLIVDLGKTEYVEWMQKNALQAYNNRNSDGISWTAWWKKTQDKDYAYTGSMTAVSAAMNAPLDINAVYIKDAYSTIQAGSFNYISKVYSTNNVAGVEMEMINMQDGGYLGYNFVEFKNRLATGIELQVANDAQARSVEIRIGNWNSKGTLAGTVTIPASDGSYTTVQGSLSRPIDGNEHIYLVFKGNKNGLKLKTFKFTSTGEAIIYPDVTDTIQGKITASHTVAIPKNIINDRLSDEVVFSCGSSDNVWIQYESPNPVKLSGYAVASGYGSADTDPKSWKLQASNNGTDWIDIDSQSGQSFASRCLLRKYTLSTSQEYKYFRLNVSERNGSTSAFRLSEWQLYGSSLSGNDITSDGGTLTVQYSGTGANTALIDKSIGTTYYVSDKIGLWIQYKAQARYKLNSYSISSGNEDAQLNPKSWELYGSSNGSEWMLIDSRENQVFVSLNATQTYYCNPEAAFRYYRLKITENNGAAGIQIAEWQLFGDFYYDFYYQDLTKSDGKLSSSAGETDETALKALTDNNPETYYSINSASLPVWIQYQSNMSVQILGYSITSSGNSIYDPKSWKIQGSTDGTTWKDITTQSNQTFDMRYAQKLYSITDAPAYNSFRLQVTASNSAEVRIAELQIHGRYISRYDVTYNPGGTLTAQWPGKVNNENPKLIDKNKDGKFYDESRKTFWAVYQSARPVKLTGYSMMSANDAVNRDPKAWTLYGSNNGTTWTKIDHQENQAFIFRQTTQYYKVSTNNRYTHFKLDVEENLGDKSVQLAEWQLFGDFNEYEKDITENGGILTSSHEPTNGTTLNALIDNNETLKYYNSTLTSAQFGSGIWFKYESPSAVKLSTYSLTSSNDNPNNDPKSWILQGSNDDTNWTDLNTQTDIIFNSRCERKEFNVSTVATYKYFRLFITARASTITGFQLAEWELFGTTTSGIRESNLENSFKVYPNPVVDFVTIDISEECVVGIYSVNGDVIYSVKMPQGKQVVDLRHYPQGVYVVKMESRGMAKTILLIKK